MKSSSQNQISALHQIVGQTNRQTERKETTRVDAASIRLIFTIFFVLYFKFRKT